MKIMIHVKSWCHLVACERAEMTAKVHCSPAKRPLRTRFSGAKISMRIQDLRVHKADPASPWTQIYGKNCPNPQKNRNAPPHRLMRRRAPQSPVSASADLL